MGQRTSVAGNLSAQRNRMSGGPMRNDEPIIELRTVSNVPNTSEVSDVTQPDPAGRSARKRKDPEGVTTYEFIDSRELARRLTVPTSWIRDQVRARSQDPLPHINLGKYVRFLWGSPEFEDWITRRIVKGNNRRVGRVQ